MGKKNKRKFSSLINDDDCDSKVFQLNNQPNKKAKKSHKFHSPQTNSVTNKKVKNHQANKFPINNNNNNRFTPNQNEIKFNKSKLFTEGKFSGAEIINKKKSKQKCQSNLQYDVGCIDLVKQRHSLPIYPIRNQLLKQLKKETSVIIIGETGSGKTTQIPQYIHEERLDNDGAICITQPRRVAAISIAKRVAQEMDTEIGGIVGYAVRFEEAFSKKTRVKYVTDGMLLRESLSDSMLTKYKWIILDEAHERSISTDILFGIVKGAQKKRRERNKVPLHIVVMSATMDVDHFSKYFNSAKVIYIEGRQYPVEIFYTREKNDDYALTCMSTVMQIHKEAPAQDDILIFLTGQEEIDSVVQTLKQIAKDPSLSDFPQMKVFPLYSALPSQRQLDVFKASGKGERKFIVSTNIAETSVTLPGIKYVIDCGRSKVRTFNSSCGFDVLKVRKISQAQSWQRSGRAGRERPGMCYRAYTLEEFQSMKLNPVPEILRANLSSVLLQLFAIGIADVVNFDFMSKPPVENIKDAESLLVLLKAVSITGDKRQLTKLGKSMSTFPLEPRFSKVIMSAVQFGCLEEILIIVAILSGESIYFNPMNQRDTIADVRRKFVSLEGDHITFIKIYRAFKAAKENKKWCFTNFLNHRNLMYASKVRDQLKEICDKLGLCCNSCGQSTEPILRCLISGLFTNIAELQVNGKYLSLQSRQKIFVHPTSVLFGSKPPYLVFTELVKTGKTYMHVNSSVDATWLVDENPQYFKTRHLRKSKK